MNDKLPGEGGTAPPESGSAPAGANGAGREEVAQEVNRRAFYCAGQRKRHAATVGVPIVSTPPAKIAALRTLRAESPGNDGATQERRLLAALGSWSLTTFEASRYLDCYDPRARVMALRRRGHRIIMLWVRTETECGRLHRIGQYSLIRGKASDQNEVPS